MRNIFLLMALTIPLTAFALQVIPIEDNQTVAVTLSAKELSRIFVQGDRIGKVHGMEGSYTLSKDEGQGAIFIKPERGFQTKAFTLFISTEQGQNYTLTIHPVERSGETIELKPSSPFVEQAERWERNSPYAESLVNLVQAMAKEETPDGYAVVESREQPLERSFGMSMQLLSLYYGEHFEGERWRIKNEKKATISLQARQFHQEDTLASALQEEILNPGEETYLYRVVKND